MPKIPIVTQKKHIENFISERPIFDIYAEVLHKILDKAAKIHAPLGLVQARAKTIDSFSEKIIRKDKYKNPLTDMTDLCGARIITHFSKQVHAISDFIEENFEVDRENSLDVKTRLKISEFGYRSIHYIVTPKKSNILGIDIPMEIRDKKAEIQVRTFHEHIWADILHDRIYKTPINVTSEWKRESARLAAILEQTDDIFADMSETIDKLSVNYMATPKPAKTENEIEVLKTLIGLNTKDETKRATNCVKLARIQNSIDRWEETVSILKDLLNNKNLKGTPVYSDILREYAYAEISSHTGNISKSHKMMEEAIAYYKNESLKLNELALCYEYLFNADNEKALEHIQAAHKLVPENPYYYASLLIEKILSDCDDKDDFLDLHISKMNEIVNECERHILLGIEVVHSYLVIGKIKFLQGNFNDSLEAYVTVLRIIKQEEHVYSKSLLDRELDNLKKLETINPFYARIIQGTFHLFLLKEYENKDSKRYLAQFKSVDLSGKVIVVCGNSGTLEENEKENYRAHIRETLRDFEGNVISGGTPKGLPGIVGSVASEKRKEGKTSFKLLGYLPKTKQVDTDYDKHIKTEADVYSVLEVVTYWSDILLSNIKPEEVTIIGIHGGFISSIEYKLGLLLGAKVCLLSTLGGSATDLTLNEAWNKFDNMLELPNDPLTTWAILNQDKKGTLTEEEIKKLAPEVHEFYRIKRRNELKPDTDTDINKYRVVMMWDKLPQSLKDSNIKQVAFMEHTLKRGGLQIRKSKEPNLFVIDKKYKTINNMARLEHARWNAERLLDGWKFGEKDVLKKTTPYLVPWDELDENIKTYDYDPIINFPELLLKIGYEIVEE